VTLQLQLDELHGDGELVDVHSAIAVHVRQSPGAKRTTHIHPFFFFCFFFCFFFFFFFSLLMK